MSFKKELEKTYKNEEKLFELRQRSSKNIFLTSALIFFICVYLLGSDQNDSFWVLRYILPLSYAFFVVSLFFVSQLFLVKIFKNQSKIALRSMNVALAIVFCIPLLVYFIWRWI